MIIQIKPSDSIAEVVQILKGGTSRVIRKEYPELEEFLWGDSLWADGYFAETIGQIDEEVIHKRTISVKWPDHATRLILRALARGVGSLHYGKIDRNAISSAFKGKGAQIHPAAG